MQAEQQYWSRYQSPALAILDPKATCENCGTAIAPSKYPSFSFVDVLVPRLGAEVTVDDAAVRVGYSYRPSILKDLSTGSGNYLDPPKHVFNGGLGYQFKTFLGREVPVSLDFSGTYHLLLPNRSSNLQGMKPGRVPTQLIGSRLLRRWKYLRRRCIAHLEVVGSNLCDSPVSAPLSKAIFSQACL